MTFSFGQTKSTGTFGSGANTGTGNSLFGNTTTPNTFGKSASTGGGLFGNTNTATTTTASLFNTSTSTAGTGIFGNTNTNPASASTGGLFGNTNTGSSLFGNTNTGTTSSIFGNTNTNTSGGLFANTNTNTNQNANQQPNQPHNQLLLTARAMSQPQLFGDERDQIVAKFNQILARWGNGKAYYSRNGDKIDLTSSNHFCDFKTVGYACLPSAKDEDGLVWLILKRPENEGLKSQVIDILHQIFNKNPNITVVVEGIRAVTAEKTEITIYVKEQKPDGTTRKLSATELSGGLNQQNIKTQLQTSIGLEEVIVRSRLSDSQVKQLLETPPACIDPVIWKQAISMNPDEKKMIPVPMLGFSALHQRLKLQEEMSKGHSNRNELLQRQIRDLQEKQANTRAKIEERKRNLLELSHRILEVTVQQEVQRKAGLAIQTEEEQLRAQLEALNNQLRAPTQFRGRLNELLSQIRMQGEFQSHSTSGSLSLDDGAVQDVKNHLQKQQAGLNHMIQRMKSAFTDLQTIETGLIEAENRRK